MDTFFADQQRWTVAEVAALLKSTKLFASLSPEHARAFVMRLRPHRVKRGAVLYRDLEVQPNFLILILQGEALVESPLAGGVGAQAVETLDTGALIGEFGALAGTHRSANVTAASELALAAMDHAGLAKMQKEAPELAFAVFKALADGTSAQLAIANRQVHVLSQINASLHQELESQYKTKPVQTEAPTEAEAPVRPVFGQSTLPGAGKAAFRSTYSLSH